MSFKFNFCNSSENELEVNNRDQPEIVWLKSAEIKPDHQIADFENIVNHARMFTCNDLEIGHVLLDEAMANIHKNVNHNGMTLADHQHSDLVTGKYEGGLKIWECTGDLIEYLSQNIDQIKLEKAQVLDLGCGAGLLGIFAFLNNSFVTFQDYNEEVLECVTIPNVLLNIEEEDKHNHIKKCKFYSGDWASFTDLLKPSGILFDYILTSETIYNLDNYPKLINLFESLLSENGVIIIAAKTYYFGVGGSTRQFMTCLENNGNFKCEVCWKTNGGIQREILRVTRK